MSPREFRGNPHPWMRDGNSAGTGAGHAKMPRGTPVSITRQNQMAHGKVLFEVFFNVFCQSES